MHVQQRAEKASTASTEAIAASLSESLAVTYHVQRYEMQCYTCWTYYCSQELVL